MLQTIGGGLTKGGARQQQAAPSYLDSILASTVCELDATAGAGYGGNGVTWANLTASPADGSARSAYDFFCGDGVTPATSPAFTGTADSAAAYWALDGGDYFTLKSGTNTAFLNALHKTTGGANFWVAMALRIVDHGSTAAVFSTQSGTSGTGLRLSINTLEQPNFIQRGDSGNGQTGNLTALTPDTDYVIILSRNHAEGRTRRWINTAAHTEASHSFNATTTNASSVLTLGAITAGSQMMPSGTRVYSFALGNEYLDNTKAGALIAYLEARHGRDYTS